MLKKPNIAEWAREKNRVTKLARIDRPLLQIFEITDKEIIDSEYLDEIMMNILKDRGAPVDGVLNIRPKPNQNVYQEYDDVNRVTYVVFEPIDPITHGRSLSRKGDIGYTIRPSDIIGFLTIIIVLMTFVILFLRYGNT